MCTEYIYVANKCMKVIDWYYTDLQGMQTKTMIQLRMREFCKQNAALRLGGVPATESLPFVCCRGKRGKEKKESTGLVWTRRAENLRTVGGKSYTSLALFTNRIMGANIKRVVLNTRYRQ